MLACPFGDCRKGLIPLCLHRYKFDAPYDCIGVFDFMARFANFEEVSIDGEGVAGSF